MNISEEQFFNFIRRSSTDESYEDQKTWASETKCYLYKLKDNSHKRFFFNRNWSVFFKEIWRIFRKIYLFVLLCRISSFLFIFSLFLNYCVYAGVKEQQKPVLKFKFEKLVRNKSVEDLEGRGLKASWRYLDEVNHLKFLKLKLVEEAKEVVNAKAAEELYEELGDLLDVLEIFFEKGKISQEKLQVFREKKKKKHGGFDKGIYVEYCLVPLSNQEEVSLFRKKSDKYLEIAR